MEALPIDSQSILRNVAQMPLAELERFMKDVNVLLFQKK